MVSMKLDQLFSFSQKHHVPFQQHHQTLLASTTTRATEWGHEHPIAGVLALLALVAVASPFAILLYYGCQGFYRYIRLHVLKNDPYQHMPRPKVPFGRWSLL